jgi:hypothetical protein
LRPARAGAKRALMLAIATIAAFLVVILALNFYEFGRGD